MERSFQSRYLNSQDQLIISLNEQIEAMMPLKQSYAALQRYQLKLSHDIQTLLSEQDYIEESYIKKINDVAILSEELDSKRNQYIDGLRNLENQKAKIILDRKNLMSACETLSSKFNLEGQQSRIVQERRKQILESIYKTQQSINTYRKLIAQIDTQIKLKSAESVEVQNQIVQSTQFNRSLAKKNQATEVEIKQINLKKQKTFSCIKSLEKNQIELESNIRDALRRNRQLSEKILVKREQLANLYHQKEYYSRLIESQLLIKEDLDLSQTKLNNLLQRKTKELERVSKQNAQLAGKIKKEEENEQKSKIYKQSLKAHLAELVKTNQILIDAMQRSCKQDERAHQILYKKIDTLNLAMIKTGQFEGNYLQKKGMVLKQKTNEMAGLKKAQKSGSTWINQLTDIENR